jgi:hypothetical protein
MTCGVLCVLAYSLHMKRKTTAEAEEEIKAKHNMKAPKPTLPTGYDKP